MHSKRRFALLSFLVSIACVSSFTSSNRRHWRTLVLFSDSSSYENSFQGEGSPRVALLLHQRVDPMAALGLLSSKGYQVTAFYVQQYENMLDQNELVNLEQLCARHGVPMHVMDTPPVARPTSEFVLSDARDKIKIFQQNGYDFDYVAAWYQVSVQLEERGDGIQLMQPSDATNGESFLLCMLNRDQLNTLVPKQNAASVSKQEKNIFGQIVDFFAPKEKSDYSSYGKTSAESRTAQQQASDRSDYEEQKDRISKDAISESIPINSPQSRAGRPLQPSPPQQQRENAAAAPRRPAPQTFSKEVATSPPLQSLDPLVGTSRADPSIRSSWRASQGPPSALGPDFTGSNTYPGADAARRTRALDPWRSQRTNNQMLQSDNMPSRPSSSWGARDGQSATDGTVSLQNVYGNSGNSAVSSWTTRTEDRGQGFYADKRVDDGGASITETTKPRDNIPLSRQYSTPKKRPEPLMPIHAPRSEAMSTWTGSTVSSRSTSNVPERPVPGSSPWGVEARSNKDIRPDPLQPTDPRPNEAVSTWTGSTYSSSSRTTNQQNPLQPIDPPPSDATSVWTGSTPGRSNERNSNDDFLRMPVSTELRTRGKSGFVADISSQSSQRSISADAPTKQTKVDDYDQNGRPPQTGSQREEISKQFGAWGRFESNNYNDFNNIDGQPNWNSPQPQVQVDHDRRNGAGQDTTAKTWEPLEAEALYEAVQDAFAYFSQLAPEQVRSDLKQRGEWYELEQFPPEILVTPKASVEECSSRVYIRIGLFQENGDWIMYGFQGETEAIVLRGFIQILSDITQEVSIDAVMALPPDEIVKVLGLEAALRQKEKTDMIAIWNSLQQQIQETLFGYSPNKSDLEYQPSTMGTSISGAGSGKSEAQKDWGRGSSTGGDKEQSSTLGSAPPFAIWDPTSSSAQSSPSPSPPSSSPSDRLSRLDRLSSTSTPKFADGAQVDTSASKAPWDNWTPPPPQDKQSTLQNLSTIGTSIPGARSGKTETKKGWGPGSSTGGDKEQSSTLGSAPPFAIWDPTSSSAQSSPSPSPPSSSPSDRLSRLDRLSPTSTPKFADGAQVDTSANKAPWDNWTPPPTPNGQSTSGPSSPSRNTLSGARNSDSQMPKSQNESYHERSATSDQKIGWKGQTDFDPNSPSVATSIPGAGRAKPEVKSGWQPSRGRSSSSSNRNSNDSDNSQNQPPWNTWTPPAQAQEEPKGGQYQRTQQQSDWKGDSDFDPLQPSVAASIPGAGQAKPELKSGWKTSRGRSESDDNKSGSNKNENQPPWNTWTPPAQAPEKTQHDQNQRAQQESDWSGDTDFDPSQPSVGASIPGARQAKPEVKSGWQPSRGRSSSSSNRNSNDSDNSQNQPPWNTWTPPAQAQEEPKGGQYQRTQQQSDWKGDTDFDPSQPSVAASIPGAGQAKPEEKSGWKTSRGRSESDDNKSDSNNSGSQPPWNTWAPPSTQNSAGDSDTFENDPGMYGIEISDFDPTLPSTGSSIPGAGGSKPTVKKGWSPSGRK